MDYTTVWQDELQMSRAEDKSADVVVCSEKSDLQLVELVLAGDETAFGDIFDRYKRLVAAIASPYFRRPEQIEEIVNPSYII